MSIPRTPTVFVGLLALVGAADAQSLESSTTNILPVDDVEITPDQRYAVVRTNCSGSYVRLYDLATGQVASQIQTADFACGAILDAVAVTNTRGIVLGANNAAFLDLTNPAAPLFAEVDVGYRPNDLAITPDGSLVVIRGGTFTTGLDTGGTFVFRTADAVQVGFHAGPPPQYDYIGTVPYSFNTDSVAVTNRHAISLSIVPATPGNPANTRVAIWDLQHASGSPTVIAETGAPGGRGDLRGAPHDVAITADGTRAVARSEEGLAVWNLNGATATLAFGGGLTGDPGPFSDTAMDSVEVTSERLVTLANVAGVAAPGQTQVEVIDWAGTRWSGRIPGKPHDLALTPNGRLALVRTGAGVGLFRLDDLGAPGVLAPVDWVAAPSGNDGYLGGLDTVAASNEAAVTLTRIANTNDTRAWFWNLVRGRLHLVSTTTIVGSRPIDVTLTPDMRRAVVSGTTKISVFHLGTGGRAFEHQAVGSSNFYQWCDGVAASSDRAVGFGQWGPSFGWIAIVDTTPIGTRYCTPNTNSTGRAASMLAMGQASVTSNSLKLCVDGASRNARGRFVQGTTQTQIPFGDGVQCVGGAVFGLRFLDSNIGGSTFLGVNFAAQTMPAGMVLPGSTWHYQYVFLDTDSPGFGVNSSDALAITFTP